MNDGGNIEASLTLDDKDFARGMKQAEKQSAVSMRKVGDEASKAGKHLAGMTSHALKMGAAFLGLKELGSIIQRIAADSRAIQSAQGAINEGLTNLGKGVDWVAESMGLIDPAMTAAEKKAALLQKQLFEVGKAGAASAHQLMQLREGLADVQAAWGDAAAEGPARELGAALERAGTSLDEFREIGDKLVDDQALNLEFTRMQGNALRAGVSLDVLKVAMAGIQKEREASRKAAEEEAKAYAELETALTNQREVLSQLFTLKKGQCLELGQYSTQSGEGLYEGMREQLEALGVTAQRVDEALDEAIGEERLSEIEAFLRLSAKERGLTARTTELLISSMRQAAAAAQDEIKQTREELEAAAETAKEYMPAAFADGFRQASAEMNNFLDAGREVATGLQGIFKSTFFDFFKTQTFDLRSLLESLLDLGLNVVSNLLGGNITQGIGSLLGFAGGGRPPGGRAVVVGERGPEVARFPPGTEIIPNHRLHEVGGVGGGTTVHLTNHINTLDVNSFRELLARDPNALAGPLLQLLHGNMQVRGAMAGARA